jgi:thiamine biosynthesis lipoprotein
MIHLVLAILLASADDSGRLQRFQEVRPAMGSTFEIIVYAADEGTARRGLDAAFARIEKLNAIFSDYESESEASRLSRAAPMQTPVTVSSEMWTVLDASLRFSEQTDGAFDVTVGPVTKLWRRARRQKQLPTEERLREALSSVGFRHVVLDHKAKTVRLATAGMRLDFGGVVKGFAADEALKLLREQGISRALVNASGNMTLGHPPPDQEGWRIGVAPLQPEDPPTRILLLSNCGVATSGDAWQSVEIGGQRYSHIVDPQTGLGLTDRSSVTVVARDGMTADVLATAVCVLGPTKGIDLIDRTSDAACLMVRQEGERVQTYQSRGFERLKQAARL